jgi:4-hydroxy-3-polyprenylbenzoate decarboxylase
MKLAIGITGASGAIYAQLLMKACAEYKNQLDNVAIVFSPNAKDVWHHELKISINTYGFTQYEYTDFNAPFASGSAGYDALVICPCSMGTMGKIAHGIADNLITRSADVMLKERKKLILAIRETPYNLIHIKNMELITLAGGIICPASPNMYSNPATIEDACNTVISRILDLLGIAQSTYRWGSK